MLYFIRFLTTLYKEFREGIPEKERYRIVLAEVRDKLFVTKVHFNTFLLRDTI